MLTTRAELQTLLHGKGTLEDFETPIIMPDDILTGDINWHAQTVIEGQGPNLLVEGIFIAGGGPVWAGSAASGGTSQRIGDQFMSIQFDVPVTAFGLDVSTFGGTGTWFVYDSNHDFVDTVSFSGNTLDNQGFIGYENAAGIGRIGYVGQDIAYVDNLEFGLASPVGREPPTSGRSSRAGHAGDLELSGWLRPLGASSPEAGSVATRAAPIIRTFPRAASCRPFLLHG